MAFICHFALKPFTLFWFFFFFQWSYITRVYSFSFRAASLREVLLLLLMNYIRNPQFIRFINRMHECCSCSSELNWSEGWCVVVVLDWTGLRTLHYIIFIIYIRIIWPVLRYSSKISEAPVTKEFFVTRQIRISKRNDWMPITVTSWL